MVATPIGNPGDITVRGLEVLRQVDVLFAEDTRALRDLLGDLDVPLLGRPLASCHDFNEEQAARAIVGHLKAERSVALVADAGTPLISDPGFSVLRLVREEMGPAFPVRPVPGPCAATAALSVAGVPAVRYLFAGFLPPKREKKCSQLRALLRQARAGLPATLVLYEAPHRLVSTLAAIAEALEEEGSSADRPIALCRELTKRFETVLRGEAREVLRRVEEDPDQQRGEMVLLVEGGSPGPSKAAEEAPAAAASKPGIAMSAAEVARLLATEMPEGKAAHLAAKICGGSQKAVKRELGPAIDIRHPAMRPGGVGVRS